ncbi:MAG: ABC transporter permease [Actinomycetes bacterium]
MIGYIVRRVLAMFAMLLVLSFMVFTMFAVLPADPARLTCGKGCTPQVIEGNRVRLGLDQPFLVQYARYLVAIPCGRVYPTSGPVLQCPVLDKQVETPPGTFLCPAPCLGYSFRRGEDVTALIVAALPVTAALAVGGVILWLVVGLSVGVLAALRRGRWQDRSAMGIALLGYSFPSFFIALILLYVFVLQLHWLPYPSYAPFSDDPIAWFQTFLLPWVSIAILYAAFYARLTRNQMLETLGEDYIRTARAKGLPERTVIYKHALRAGITPVVTSVGLDFAALLGGAIIIEQVFTLPGLGKLTLESTLDADLSVISGTVLLAGFFVIVANLIVDILYASIDPRVRLT